MIKQKINIQYKHSGKFGKNSAKTILYPNSSPVTRHLSLLLLLVACHSSLVTTHAQTIIFDQNNADQIYNRQMYGPNRNVFWWIHLDVGFNTAGDPDLTKFWGSSDAAIEFKMKYKLNRTLDWGWGAGYRNMDYKLTNEGMAYFDSNPHDKAFASSSNLVANTFLRYNPNRYRGDIIRWYVDAGCFMRWAFADKIIFKDGTGSTKVKTKASTNLMSNLAIGPEIHVGYGFIGAYARYEALASKPPTSRPTPDLGKLSFGIELNVDILQFIDLIKRTDGD